MWTSFSFLDLELVAVTLFWILLLSHLAIIRARRGPLSAEVRNRTLLDHCFESTYLLSFVQFLKSVAVFHAVGAPNSNDQSVGVYMMNKFALTPCRSVAMGSY